MTLSGTLIALKEHFIALYCDTTWK